MQDNIETAVARMEATWAAHAEAKQAAGRYTLREAAKAIAEGAGERLEMMLPKLKAAVTTRLLPTFEPGRNSRLEYGPGPGRFSVVREFHEEVYWDDLNTWLADHEKRVAFRFPAPPGVKQPQLTPKPVQRQPAQEAAILAELAALSFDAQALPPAPPGKASPAKRAVQANLGYSPDVMNKAWHRLRAAGSIKDA